MDALHLAVAAGTVAIAIAVGRWRGRRAAAVRSRRARAVGRAAVDGERAAAGLLADAGYHVVAAQVRHVLEVTVDDQAYDAGLRCDYLVERAGQRWVAEVKTGAHAPSLANPATRRQLLEYQLAFAAVGVVLVDVDANALHEVRFAVPAATPQRLGLAVGAGFVLGAIVTAGAIALLV